MGKNNIDDSIVVMEKLARTYLETGKYSQSIKYYQKILEEIEKKMTSSAIAIFVTQ